MEHPVLFTFMTFFTAGGSMIALILLLNITGHLLRTKSNAPMVGIAIILLIGLPLATGIGWTLVLFYTLSPYPWVTLGFYAVFALLGAKQIKKDLTPS
jgi:hypothetical protein